MHFYMLLIVNIPSHHDFNSVLEYAHPFERIIQHEELWLYKHPHKEHDTVPTSILFVSNEPLYLSNLLKNRISLTKSIISILCIVHNDSVFSRVWRLVFLQLSS